VPVYNPGRHIDVCIAGYLSQTIPLDRREVIFVDDGSTDDTPELLDRLAVAHRDVHVIHQANSGWSGRPRNVGIDAARGDYVFFCDQDDWLSPKALERMVAMARRTGADVVVPKMVGHRRPTPHSLFRANIDHAVLGKDRLMTSLTPHKMVRRALLNDHGLRFPEERRRLEDHLFVVKAYLLSDVISVLSDYPCYHRTRRTDGGNAAFQRWEPSFYYRFVAEVIDVIYERTEPGELRDALLRRPYVSEMLGKLRGRKLLRWDRTSRREIFDEVRALAIERFPPDFHARLPVALRAHAQAVVDNRLDQLMVVAADTASARARTVMHDLSWTDSGWVAQIEAQMVLSDGSPIRLIPNGERWTVDPRLIPAEIAAESYERREVTGGQVDVMVRHRTDGLEWYLETNVLPELIAIDGDPDHAHRLTYRGTLHIDPATIAGGRPLSVGKWDVALRMEVLGMFRTPYLKKSVDLAPVLSTKALILPVQRLVTPVIRPGGAKNVVIRVVRVTGAKRAKALLALPGARDMAATATGDVVATLDWSEPGGTPAVECHAILVNGAAAARTRLGRFDKAAAGAHLASALRQRPAGSRRPSAID
jgi:poly(ribitol-phosphate) beta-N-acetylglucosaminyltransferase